MLWHDVATVILSTSGPRQQHTTTYCFIHSLQSLHCLMLSSSFIYFASSDLYPRSWFPSLKQCPTATVRRASDLAYHGFTRKPSRLSQAVSGLVRSKRRSYGQCACRKRKMLLPRFLKNQSIWIQKNKRPQIGYRLVTFVPILNYQIFSWIWFCL